MSVEEDKTKEVTDTVDSQSGFKTSDFEVLEGESSKDLGKVFVDVSEKDWEDDKYNMSIVVYLKPQTSRNEIEDALKRTCLSVFGEDSSGFDTLFFDQNAIRARIGHKMQDLDNFEITINWPKAKFYSVDKLESIFIPELKKNLT